MNAANAAPRMGFKFMMTVRDGPDAGATFQLLPPRVTIGRGAENNIVLNDPRMSRNAAMIDMSMEQIVVTDLSGRGTMLVNDDYMDRASLRDNDTIRIGDTVLTFFVEAIPLQQVVQPNGQLGLAPAPGFQSGPQAAPPPPQMRPQGDAGKARFYMILVAVLVIGGVFFMTENKKAAKSGSGISTTEEIEKEIKDSEKRVEEFQQKRVFKNPEEKTRFNEAQKHFMEGFRDYQKSSWTRAMRSFETARAIDPQHALAGRYYKLAEKQRDEMIALLTLEARRYREKGMYSRCSAQFEKVLDLIPNKQDLKYEAADKLKKECDEFLGGDFQK